jgi:hypothetical protein
LTVHDYDTFDMGIRRRTYEQWKADRGKTAAWAASVDRALPAYERRRPRDPDEAQLLRRRGTPERLIGPSRPE